MRQVVDLTHRISGEMPVYPGAERPVLEQASTVESSGFAETILRLHSHTGTHVDAPAHMVAGAPSLDRLPAGHFVGQAAVVDVSGPGESIGVERLAAQSDLVAGCEFVLLHTGWSRYWGDPRYFSSFPVLSPDAASWLIRLGLKGIGVDAISADPVGPPPFVNHLVLLSAGLVIVENLTGLGPLCGRRVLFSCLPLSFGRADGSPVRAVALVE